MIVVGGVYSERVSYPPTDDLYGSGLKAAAAIGRLSKVTLMAAVSKRELPAATSACKTYGLQTKFVTRPSPIIFSYVTPLAKPLIIGLPDKKVEITAEGDTVLVFGMLESAPKVRAKRLILDPQSPTQATIAQFKDKAAESLAIVLNRQEAARIGGSEDPNRSGPRILKKAGAKVVVVKHGALGALIVEKGKKTWIGAHPTQSVWPIGSGDVFSAVFAWAWGEKKMAPVRAAKLASTGAAIWCSTRVLPLPENLAARAKKLAAPLRFTKAPRVYIAGPFFSASQVWLLEVTKSALENLGADTFSPLHHVGRGEDEVAKKDLAGLTRCSSVLALLDEEDSGTIFETGYARSMGIPVIGFAAANKSSSFKMLRGTGIEMHAELSTAIYRAVWAGR